MNEVEEIQKQIEDGYANMMVGIYKLQKLGLYQDAYDNLCTTMSLIREDIDWLMAKRNIDTII